jgi:hypothetical protein
MAESRAVVEYAQEAAQKRLRSDQKFHKNVVRVPLERNNFDAPFSRGRSDRLLISALDVGGPVFIAPHRREVLQREVPKNNDA